LECHRKKIENGCSWNQDITLYAAMNGYLNCLKYAHKNGFSLHKDTLSHLERYVDKIEFDDKWWREFLFNQDLSSYPKLQRIVKEKKEEIQRLKKESEILKEYIPKDVIQYVIYPYF
jgi:hypothetical protein